MCFYINNKGVIRMETKTLDYHGRDFTLLRVGDHLWVSKESVNDQRLVNEFNLEKFCLFCVLRKNTECCIVIRYKI